MKKTIAGILFATTGFFFVAVTAGGEAQAGHTKKDKIHCQAYHPKCGYENAPPAKPYPPMPGPDPDDPRFGTKPNPPMSDPNTDNPGFDPTTNPDDSGFGTKPNPPMSGPNLDNPDLKY